MKAQIPWLRVFVEGVVIVGSILLALALDTWWDGVQEGGQEQAILVGLEVEFSRYRDVLQGSLELHKSAERSLARQLAWTTAAPSTISEDDADSALSTISFLCQPSILAGGSERRSLALEGLS